MGCEKRVFRNNQIRFDIFLTTRVGIEVRKIRVPFRERHGIGLRTLSPNWRRT
jgi:hypothetical protein